MKKLAFILISFIVLAPLSSSMAQNSTSQSVNWSVSKESYILAKIHDHMTSVETSVILNNDENVEVVLNYVSLEANECDQGCYFKEIVRAYIKSGDEVYYAKEVGYNVFRTISSGLIKYNIDFKIIASTEKPKSNVVSHINTASTYSNTYNINDIVFEGSVKFKPVLICDNLGTVTKWSDDMKKNDTVKMPCLNAKGLH